MLEGGKGSIPVLKFYKISPVLATIDFPPVIESRREIPNNSTPPQMVKIGLERKERPPTDGESTSAKIPDRQDAQDTPASPRDEHSSQDPADPCLIFLRSIWHGGGVKTGSISTTWEFLSRYRALQNPRIPPKLIFSMPVASNKENDWQMKLLDNNSDVENQIMLSRSSSSRQQSDKSWTIVGQSGENWENGAASGRRKGPAVILTNLSDS